MEHACTTSHDTGPDLDYYDVRPRIRPQGGAGAFPSENRGGPSAQPPLSAAPQGRGMLRPCGEGPAMIPAAQRRPAPQSCLVPSGRSAPCAQAAPQNLPTPQACASPHGRPSPRSRPVPHSQTAPQVRGAPAPRRKGRGGNIVRPVEILRGLREIAAFLQVSQSEVLDLEGRGAPILRHKNILRAEKAEIWEWLKQQS